MTKVREVMTSPVFSVDASKTVFEAVKGMLDRDIGCAIVVVDRKNKNAAEEGVGSFKKEVIGIITKGDALRETVLKKSDPQKTFAEEVMSTPVVKISQEAALEEAVAEMAKNKISKLPVVSAEGELVGIITSTDVIRKKARKILAALDEI